MADIDMEAIENRWQVFVGAMGREGSESSPMAMLAAVSCAEVVPTLFAEVERLSAKLNKVREIHAPFTILMCGCESHGDPDGDCSECSISGRVLSSDSFSVTFAVQVSRELLADWEVSTE